ncbi:protein MIZU-KUSSEI 1 [Mercurialis annua]|uniref:protein MIZU-KUSSEI 1 n=1 Tax=Mercurialis annua TaxID=3986 RepID=UPI00215DEB4E|nr:protein MIZU-KUSSEI 1 [Mercurialis annua]
MTAQQVITLQRNSSCSRSTREIIPSNYMRSTSVPRIPEQEHTTGKLLVRRGSPVLSVSLHHLNKLHSRFSSLLRSIFKIVALPSIIIIPACKWLSLSTNFSITPSLGRKVTGTLFGNRHGHVSFSVQDDPRSEPVLLLELAMSTSMLVKEMSSGLVRIALECEKAPVPVTGTRLGKLFNEPNWSMYCNGNKYGYAVSRTCTELDRHVLRTVQSVSVGAGVIPMVEDSRKTGGSEGELLYMRAKFERVVGNRDSEAFYMMNPDGSGGPELSIFLLRI